MTSRFFLLSDRVTTPPISEMTACPLGRLASNSSSTRGRPCVISPPATPPVEGTHRKLRAWLADGLRRDDADRFADVDEVARRHVRTVALAADTVFALAGEYGTDLHFLDTGLGDCLSLQGGNHLVGRGQHLARFRVENVAHGHAPADSVFKRLHDIVAAVEIGYHDALCLLAQAGKAVVLAHNDIVRNIDKASRQITRVGRP